jgi:hypothetical protein
VEFPVHGTLTLDGATVDCQAYRLMVDDDELDGPSATPTCGPDGVSFSFYRPAGTYRVGLRKIDEQLQSKVLAPPIDVLGPSSVSLNIATTPVAGEITMNGAPITSSDCTSVFVVFTGRFSHGPLPVHCDGAHWTFSGAVPPDDYQLTLQLGLGAPRFPVPFTIGPPLGQITVGQTPVVGLRENFDQVVVSGTVTLNGAPFTRPCASVFFLLFEALPRQDFSVSVPVSCSGSAWTFMAPLFPGTYRVSASGFLAEIPGSGAVYDQYPLQLVVPSVSLTAPTSELALDVKAVNVSGVITVDGKPFPPPCHGLMRFGANRLTVQCDPGGGLRFSGPIFPGTMPVSLSMQYFTESSLIGEFVLSPSIDLH